MIVGHLANEDFMIATVVDGVAPALEVDDCAGRQRGAVSSVSDI